MYGMGIITTVMTPNVDGMYKRRKPNEEGSNYWKEALVIQRGFVVEGVQLMLREDPAYICYQAGIIQKGLNLSDKKEVLILEKDRAS